MEDNPYPRDRVIQAEEIARHPALYFLNSEVLETTAYDIADAIFHVPINLLPQASKDAFWVSQLQYLSTRYKRKASPQSLKNEIREIVEYCHAHHISIIFVIPPQHMDAQRRVGSSVSRMTINNSRAIWQPWRQCMTVTLTAT